MQKRSNTLMTFDADSKARARTVCAILQAQSKVGALHINSAKLGPKPREGFPNGYQKSIAVGIADIALA